MTRAGASAARPTVITLEEGAPLDFAGVRGFLKIDGADTGDRFAAAQFPHIAPHVLAAPLHRHHHEDEYSYVVEGTLSVQLGDEVITALAGTWVIKRRGQWHTFWNAADTPCRTIELVSPAGFQRYFDEVARLGADLDGLRRLNAKYAIDMDFDSVPVLCERFGLTFPGAQGQPLQNP